MMLMHHSLLIHLCVLNYFTITTPFRMTITFYNILIADPIRSPESPSVETSNLFYRLGNEIILAALSLLCVVKGTCYVQQYVPGLCSDALNAHIEMGFYDKFQILLRCCLFSFTLCSLRTPTFQGFFSQHFLVRVRITVWAWIRKTKGK